jgi:hypothetical protein
MTTSDTTILIVLGFTVVAFIVLRIFFLWYWKIDTIVENQEKQIVLLKHLVEQTKPETAQVTSNASKKFSGVGSLTTEQKAKAYDEGK